jgi:hypothetical protein
MKPRWAKSGRRVINERGGVNVHVVTVISAAGDITYFLEHDFDVEMFSDLDGNGPFRSRDHAERAADRVRHALACISE